MTTTAMRSLPGLARWGRLARLFAVGATLVLPTFAHAAAASSIRLDDPETYALLAATFGMVVFMAARRSDR